MRSLVVLLKVVVLRSMSRVTTVKHQSFHEFDPLHPLQGFRPWVVMIDLLNILLIRLHSLRLTHQQTAVLIT